MGLSVGPGVGSVVGCGVGGETCWDAIVGRGVGEVVVGALVSLGENVEGASVTGAAGKLGELVSGFSGPDEVVVGEGGFAFG